jgi:type I restriction-modification system DNA methylase subunit
MSFIEISIDDLKSVTNRSGLFLLLRNKLGWPSVDPEDPFAYDFQVDGISNSAKISQIVPFSINDPHPIMLVESEKEIKRGAIREILRGVRLNMRTRARFQNKAISDIVFIIASNLYNEIKFCRFTEIEGRLPKLLTFGWTKGEENTTRTLREINLPALKMPLENELGGWDWSVNTWRTAWDIEVVQKEFFQKLKSVFEKYLEAIIIINEKGDSSNFINQGEEVARLMLQTIVNRLLFLVFIQKKGWLVPPVQDGVKRSKEYLFALFDQINPKNQGFEFHQVMRVLFFEGLCESADSKRHSKKNLNLIGKVPYLHGSLFEAGKYEHKEGDLAKLGWTNLPNGFYEELIGVEGVFRMFNFTISESSPDDVELAVDPEMLGLVFEELMTLREAQELSKRSGDDPRHATGSYYTPRNIVQYMCRESLKIYLEPFSKNVNIEALVDQHILSGTDIPLIDLKKWIENIKVCDPACGSGAYLVGMLQELNEVLKVLDNKIMENSTEKARSDYKRKILLLQNSIYGVDLQEFAASMARLRFWLSVAVEMVEPDPLPNLEYKIESGDSLTAPDPSNTNLFLKFVYEDADKIGKMRSEYSDPFNKKNKAHLKKEIDGALFNLRKIAEDIAESPVGAFDWRVEFAEVFIQRGDKVGGFDIILANPPYIRQEEIDALNLSFNGGYKSFLLSKYSSSCTGKSDLYAYFYSRSLQLLRPGGCQIFICSNSWLDVLFGRDLQKFLLDNGRVRKIIDSSFEKQFSTADINTIISIFTKENPSPNFITEFILLKNEFDISVNNPKFQRIVKKSYKQIKLDASDGGNVYSLGKWGGLYLRAPDIYLSLLESFQARLVPLTRVAVLERGTTTGADVFFYTEIIEENGDHALIRDAFGEIRTIESSLIRVPLLKDPRDARTPLLDLSKLRSRRLALPDDLSKFPLAKEYVNIVENKLGLHLRPSLQARSPWWRYRIQQQSDFLLPVKPKRSIVISWVQGVEVSVNKSFYLVRARGEYRPLLAAATLFSSFGAIAREVMGRANFGQGVLELISEEAKLLPVLTNVTDQHFDEISSAFKNMLNRPVKVIYNEMMMLDRKRLDSAILIALGVSENNLESTVNAIQDAARRLVWDRQSKPGTFTESRFNYEEWLSSGLEFPIRGENS